MGGPGGDDAVVFSQPSGALLVQSVDHFRCFAGGRMDPYLFGRIGAVHAMGDVWAMGADPAFALATAVVRARRTRGGCDADAMRMRGGALPRRPAPPSSF